VKDAPSCRASYAISAFHCFVAGRRRVARATIVPLKDRVFCRAGRLFNPVDTFGITPYDILILEIAW